MSFRKDMFKEVLRISNKTNTVCVVLPRKNGLITLFLYPDEYSIQNKKTNKIIILLEKKEITLLFANCIREYYPDTVADFTGELYDLLSDKSYVLDTQTEEGFIRTIESASKSPKEVLSELIEKCPESTYKSIYFRKGTKKPKK